MMKKGEAAVIAKKWDAQALEESARGERNARVCRRLLALRQLALGKSMQQAAQVSLVSVIEGSGADSGLSAWRGEGLRVVLAEEFEARYSLSGVYALMHRLDLSNLVPRPQHPDSDAAAQAAFKKSTGTSHVVKYGRRGSP